MDAYGTGVFGENVARSEISREMLSELANLNFKELRQGLEEDELERQSELITLLGIDAHGGRGVAFVCDHEANLADRPAKGRNPPT